MKKTSLNLTDIAHAVIMKHKIKLQKESIKKNISFTDALNDFVEENKK